MAKKQTNTSMFERAGMALGQSKSPTSTTGFSKAFKDSFKIKVEEGKKKTKDLLAKFPNGISISKVPESLRPQLTTWLKDNKQAYADAGAIIAQGSGAEGYDEAVETQNNINSSYQDISTQMENMATNRQTVLDRAGDEKNGRAMSMTDLENLNMDNIATENYGADGLNAKIVDNKWVFVDADGKETSPSDLNVGTEYNFELEDTIDDLQNGITDLTNEKDPYWNRKATKDKVEKLARDPQAVKNYMFQNPELMDTFISNQTGIPITVNGEPNPAWNDFKAGIGDKMPRIGDVEPQEKSSFYEDFLDSNKTDIDFSDGFVDTVMQMLDNSYATGLENNQEQEVVESEEGTLN